MKALRFTLAFFLLAGVSHAQSAQPQAQGSAPVVIELHRGDCPDVRIGSRIRFTFRMSFDGPVPDHQQPDTHPYFANAQQRPLGLEDIAVKKLTEPDVWEFSGTVSKLSSKGEYQMTDLWSRFTLGYDPVLGSVYANANLTPEAREEVKAYKVCLRDGTGPVPVGKITNVGPPEK
jgi:hypothetical protein